MIVARVFAFVATSANIVTRIVVFYATIGKSGLVLSEF